MEYVDIIHPNGERTQRFDVIPVKFVLMREDAPYDSFRMNLAAGDEESWYRKLTTDSSYWRQ